MRIPRSKQDAMVALLLIACPIMPARGGEFSPDGGGSPGGDSEFGEIEEVSFRKSNWEPWRISLTSDVRYFDDIRSIDNLAPTLAEFLDSSDDFVFRTGISVDYTPLITDNLFFDSSLTQEFYRFDKLDRLDSDYFSGDLGLIYVIQGLRDLQVFGRYRYENLQQATFDGEIYSNNAIEVGVQQVYRFAPGQLVFGELKGQLSLNADPGIAQFDEYSINLGYQWDHHPFKVTVLNRFAYLDFQGIDRSDVNNITMLRGEYLWRDWLTLAADTSFTVNNSTLDAFEYDTFGVGVGFSLHMTF